VDSTGNDLHCGYLDVVALFSLLGTDTRPSLFPDDQTRSLLITTDVFTLDEGCLPGVRHLFWSFYLKLIYFHIQDTLWTRGVATTMFWLIECGSITLDQGCSQVNYPSLNEAATRLSREGLPRSTTYFFTDRRREPPIRAGSTVSRGVDESRSDSFAHQKSKISGDVDSECPTPNRWWRRDTSQPPFLFGSGSRRWV